MMDWKEKMVYVLSLVNKQNVTRRTKTNGPEETGETVHTFTILKPKVKK